MPKELEKKLWATARKYAANGRLKKKPGQTTKEAQEALVYGTMRKTGWKPGREK